MIEVKRKEDGKIFDIAACAKEIVKVLEEHNVIIGNMDRVLDAVRDEIMSSTPIHIA